MKGTPRSVWLSWANRTAGLWTSAFTAAAKRQQAALFKTMTTPPAPAKPRRRKPAKR